MHVLCMDGGISDPTILAAADLRDRCDEILDGCFECCEEVGERAVGR